MRKIYFLSLLLLQSVIIMAEPTCVPDVVRFIESGCGEDIGDIGLSDPPDGYSFTMEGATEGKGEGTASDNFFRIGKTIVTYHTSDGTVLCSFSVTVINKSSIDLSQQELPVLEGDCKVIVGVFPEAFETCTEQVFQAVTEDPLEYSKPGEYTIHWRYVFAGVEVFQQEQQVIVHARDGFVPDLKELPIAIFNCKGEVTPPSGLYNCSDKIVGKTEGPMNFEGPLDTTITWVYYAGDEPVYKQEQRIIVRTGQFLPDNDTLPEVVIDCKGELTAPEGYYECQPEKIVATNNGPTVFDYSLDTTIVWIYYYKEKAVYRQTQHVIVNTRGRMVLDKDTLPSLTGFCSVNVIDTPTAHNSCTGRIIYGRTTDPLKYDKPGNYKITWVFGGRIPSLSSVQVIPSLTQIQEVVVKRGVEIVPDRRTLDTLRGDCSATATITPTARGNCGHEIIQATTADSLTYTTPGTHIIHWNYRDKNNHRFSQTQAVIIGSENRIIPDSVKLADVEGTCSLTINNIPFARNRCTGVRIKGESRDPLNYNTAGDYTIHWVYSDTYDTVMQEQKVRVKTRDSLIPEVAVLPNLEGNCEVRVTRFPTALNNCTGKVITAITSSPLVVSTPGINLIHWIYKDGSASFTQVQMVTVSQRSVSLKVYPNPTRDEFRILAESCTPDGKLSLKVYDILGRLVEARNALHFNEEIRFGSGYPGSTYFAQVLWGDKQYMYKLIKCK